MKVRYIGSLNIVNNGVTIGSISGNSAEKEYSVTDWSNAVIEMDVFNSHEKDLEIGLLLYKKVDGANNYLIQMFDPLPAGKWTHVAISLRAIGWAGDFIGENSGYIDFKIRQLEDEESGNYNYTFYCCNPDVTNYDPVRHPNLETRTPEEIKQEIYDSEAGKISGTEYEKKTAILLRDSANYVSTTTTDVVKNGEASLKYTFTRSSIAAPTVNRGTFLNDQNGLLNSYNTVTDWNNAYLGFWAKNPTEYSVAILPCFANSKDGKTFNGSTNFSFYGYASTGGVYHHKALRANTDWTYMEWSLNELYPSLHTEDVTTFKLALSTEIISLEGEAVTFYLDDIKIYSKKPIDKDESALVSGTTTSSLTQEVYNEVEANVKDGNSSIKVSYGGELYGSAFEVANGGIALMIPDNQQQAVYSSFSAYDAENDTYKSATEKTYAGFWVKNATGKQLNVCFNLRLYYPDGEGAGEYRYGSIALNQVSTGNNTKALAIASADTDWHYYELEITDLPDTFYSAHKVRMGIAATIANAVEGDTFYIDDFDIYHGSKKAAEDIESEALIAKLDAIDTELVLRTRRHNMNQELNTNVDYVKVGSQSIKVSYDTSTTVNSVYDVTSGGIAFLTESGFESVYDDFTAYDATNRTYVSATKKTYVGFWVKNTTGKKLTVNVNLRLWGNGAVINGSNTLNSVENGLEIAGSDTAWHYYELELNNLPTLSESYPIIRMGLATSIENVQNGDTFYIDGFDIYHGSRA